MRYILIFVYIVVSILLFVLNWDLFTTVVNVDLGFGSYNLLPFFLLQIFGALILGIFALVDGMKDLKREVKISELQNRAIQLEKDIEIISLKESRKNESDLTNQPEPSKPKN